MTTHSILLIGANGQVGHALQRALARLGQVVCLTRAQLDLAVPVSQTDALVVIAAACKAAHAGKPTIIVNAAAYTAVDRAEAEPQLAEQVNARVPALLAGISQESGACLVHYSTDYVFDGSKAGAYLESDIVHPLSAYGLSKLHGEQAIVQGCQRHLIFRTSWVVGAHGGNFLKTMLKLGQERDTLRVVADQFGAPTSAELIAKVTAQILELMAGQDAEDPRWGIYHLAAAGQTSWHGYAQYVLDRARAKGWPIKVEHEAILPIATEDYPVAAKRPLNSRLDTSKIRQTFPVVLPDWQSGVDEVLAALR